MAPLSPVEQKQAYLNLQAGGEAPLQGFRKPAPEKPKGMFFTEIAMLWRAAKFCFEFFFFVSASNERNAIFKFDYFILRWKF